MAQKFYNDIDLQQLELLNGTIENQTSDANAGTGVNGQLYFDTTDLILKVYDEVLAAWKAVGGTSTGTVESVAATFAGTGFTATVTDPTENASIAITANGASTDYINGEGNFIAFPADNNTTYALGTATGTGITTLTGSDAATTSLKIQGTTDEVEVTVTGTTANGVYTVGLPDDVTITDALTVGGTGEFTGQVTIPVLPLVDTDAASKKYVDDSVVGGLIYQGGYNATTNTPDLDSGTSIAVLKGWTYTVTVEGLFFTEQVRVGDVLISEIDQAAGASALANWTTVQNNIDLASLTQVGIGNVVPGGAIDVSYSSGTATVSVEDSTASNKGAVIVAASTGISVGYASGTATVTNTDTNTSNTTTGTIAIGAVSGAVVHTFGQNTLVQTFDAGTGATVFCDVVRGTTSPYTVTATISAAQTTAITILVQKIG